MFFILGRLKYTHVLETIYQAPSVWENTQKKKWLLTQKSYATDLQL